MNGHSTCLMSFNASSFLKTSSLWISSVMFTSCRRNLYGTHTETITTTTTTTQRCIPKTRENQYFHALPDGMSSEHGRWWSDARIVCLHFVIVWALLLSRRAREWGVREKLELFIIYSVPICTIVNYTYAGYGREDGGATNSKLFISRDDEINRDCECVTVGTIVTDT